MKHLTMWKVEKKTIIREFDRGDWLGYGHVATHGRTIIGYYKTPKEAEDKIFDLTGERILWLSKGYFRKQIECSNKINFEELYCNKSDDVLLRYMRCATKRMRDNNSTEHRMFYNDDTEIVEWYEINAQTFSWSDN